MLVMAQGILTFQKAGKIWREKPTLDGQLRLEGDYEQRHEVGKDIEDLKNNK